MWPPARPELPADEAWARYTRAVWKRYGKTSTALYKLLPWLERGEMPPARLVAEARAAVEPQRP